jgi:hypothetical protein
MREGWRKLLVCLGMVLLGTIVQAAPPDPLAGGPGNSVRMTIEVAWSMPAAREGVACNLELTDGTLVEALAWPSGERRAAERLPGGAWTLGTEPSGRVRARIEAPLSASLRIQAGGQVFQFPLLPLLDGPRRSPSSSPVEVAIERLPWDSLTVALDQGDGTAAPGATVPVSVGFNLLTPEPTDVALRCSAELRPIRGGEPVWRQPEVREVVATDTHDAPRLHWNVNAPLAEGTYVLEVRTAWESVAAPENRRLPRLFRRLKSPPAEGSAVRRVTLVVVGKGKEGAVEPTVPAAVAPADTIDLSRLRSYRPTATGRAPVVGPGRDAWAIPELALVEERARDRLRGWILRNGPEAANLAPADGSGLAWSAVGLKVAHPGRPHRLSLTVLGGLPSALGVGLVDPAGAGGRPRVVLDACASGPLVAPGKAPASFSWLVWPEATEPVLILVNRDAGPVQLGTVTLAELAEVPAGPPISEPGAEVARGLGIDLTGPHGLDRFGGEPGQADVFALGRNLSQYLNFCGASSVVLPERLGDRSRRGGLDGQAAEDATGPDRLDLLLRLLERNGCTAWLDLNLDGGLPGLPDPGSDEALKRGLVRVDRQGAADGPLPTYHPLHAEVREALKRRVAEAAAIRTARPALIGLLIRLGPGPTLLGGPDTGLDDPTFARFVREMFDPEPARSVPGLDTTDPDRFAARSKYLAGLGRMPWLTWRSRGIAALYGELTATARRAGPGALLAVATPVLDDGPAGNEARRVDQVGFDPRQAWRAVGLDLDTWPTGENAPIVLRGASLSTEDLAHDLATSPELDAQVAARPGRGLILGTDADRAREDPEYRPIFPGDTGLRLSALPLSSGPEGDEPLSHALAALDARWILLSAAVAAGHEERIRRFARIFRALPAAPVVEPPLEHQPFGIAVRPLRSGPNTFLEMANDTPYPIRLETVLGGPSSALVDDLGRGLRLTPEATGAERHVVLDLPPFGAAAIRVGAADVKVGPLVPYPSQAVVDSLFARYNELLAQLKRLDRSPAEDRVGPPNPGFEPAAPPGVQLTVARGPSAPRGWSLLGGGSNTAEIDPSQPHSGRGSLRLTALEAPASVASESFVPKVQETLDLQAWYRADRPETPLRVWIEGEASGQPFVRQTDLTVSPDWSALGVRIADVPAGGLTRLRVRYELLAPGSVWIDDVSISGEALSEPERTNAKRALLAALRAYHDKRYADFARLAGSRWARHPGAVGESPATAEGSTSDRAGMLRTGGGTALPPDRRLR